MLPTIAYSNRSLIQVASAPEPPPAYDQLGKPPDQYNVPTAPAGIVFPVHLPGQPQPQVGYTQPLPQLLPGQPMLPYASYQQSMGTGSVVIQIQPGALQHQLRWVTVPPTIAGCPPGLEFLHGLSKIVVRQKQELLEFISAIETPNRYSIETPTGEQIYFASEDADFVQAQMMGANRGYRFKVVDGFNRTAFVVSRPLNCCFGCEWSKRHSSVEGAGEIFGSISARRNCCASFLTISDGHHKDVITIDGPCYCSRYCSDSEFPLTSAVNGSSLGEIKRLFRGYIYSNYSKADVFEIKFPFDLSVRMKAAVIGACIMIDFLEFETRNAHKYSRRH